MLFDDLDENAIPKFTHDGNLPPFLGAPTTSQGRSPFHVFIGDFIKKYATTKRRCAILRGFICLRECFFSSGCYGYQWIDGSFVSGSKKEPGDIDIVTFIDYKCSQMLMHDYIVKYKLISSAGSKNAYDCDSYLIDISKNVTSRDIVFHSVFWYGLFSHTRDSVWKGFAVIDLPNTIKECSICHAILDRMESDL